MLRERIEIRGFLAIKTKFLLRWSLRLEQPRSDREIALSASSVFRLLPPFARVTIVDRRVIGLHRTAMPRTCEGVL